MYSSTPYLQVRIRSIDRGIDLKLYHVSHDGENEKSNLFPAPELINVKGSLWGTDLFLLYCASTYWYYYAEGRGNESLSKLPESA